MKKKLFKIIITCSLTILPIHSVFADGSDALVASPMASAGSAEGSAASSVGIEASLRTRRGVAVLLTTVAVVVGGVIAVTYMNDSQRRNKPDEYLLKFVSENGIIEVNRQQRDNILEILHTEMDLIYAIDENEGLNDLALAEISTRMNLEIGVIYEALSQARAVADEVHMKYNPEGSEVVTMRPSQFVNGFNRLPDNLQAFLNNYAALRGIVLESAARSLAIDALQGTGGLILDTIFQRRAN